MTLSFEQNTVNQSLVTYTKASLKQYGSSVVEERAIPDYRDGLKPVHRAILWAMYDLGLHYNKGYKKSARTVGDVIGRFHPHGDASTYEAMVTIANTTPNLVDGSGNWGDVANPAAAPRYTEARLSEFANKILLDKIYIHVVPKVKNYSNDCEFPLFLPAKLPVQLLIGSPTIPAYGVSAGNPPFHIKGILELIKIGTKRKLTIKDLVKYLEPCFTYGGLCISSDEERRELFSTGKGTLTYLPEIKVIDDTTIKIMSHCPGFASENTINSRLEKVASIQDVRSVVDESGKNAGKYKTSYTIRLKKGSLDNVLEDVYKVMTCKDSYNLGYTHRKKDETTFGRLNFVDFLNTWIEYRTKLEVRVLRYLIFLQQKEIKRLSQLVFAVDNRADILKALDSKNPDTYLIRLWNKPESFVKEILDLKVRRLAKLEKKELLRKIGECKKVITDLQKDEKHPNVRVHNQVKGYLQDVYIKELIKF